MLDHNPPRGRLSWRLRPLALTATAVMALLAPASAVRSITPGTPAASGPGAAAPARLAQAGVTSTPPQSTGPAGLRWDADGQTFHYDNAYRRTMKVPGQGEQSAQVRVRADLALRAGRPGHGTLTLLSLELGDEQGNWTKVERIPGAVSQVALNFDTQGRVTFVDSVVAYHHERRYWLARAPAAPLAMPLLPQNVTRIVANVAASVHPRTGKVQSADSEVGRKNVRAVKVPVTAPMVELVPREILQAFVLPSGRLQDDAPATAPTPMAQLAFEVRQRVDATVRFDVEGEGVTPEPAEHDRRSLRGGIRTRLQARGVLDPAGSRLNLLAGALDVAVPIGEAGLVTTHSAFSFSRR